MKKRTGIFAMATGAMLAAASTALAGGTITFDLSNVTVTNPIHPSIAIPGGAGTVTGIDWNISYTAGAAVGSSSWASEIALELVAPGATANAVISSGFGSPPGGYYPGTPSNAGTHIWGSANPWNDGFSPDVDLGFPDDSSGTYTHAGSTNALNGLASGGNWALNIFDAYNDGNLQGRFSEGSSIAVHYIPEPGTAALLGLAGLAVVGRRRA